MFEKRPPEKQTKQFEKRGGIVKIKSYSRLLALGIIILSMITIGCAATKSAVGDLQTGLVLEYRFPQDQTLTYKADANSVQNQDMMGQTMTTTIKTDAGYSIKGTGADDQNNLMAQVTINNIDLAINSMQGNTNPDTSGLSGKSFSATYSPKGKEVEVTGLDELPKISMGMGGERSAKEFFTDLLPLLPDKAVKTGDTWTTPIDRSVQQGPITLTIKGEAVNVLEGVETVQGMECVVIKTRTENAIEGSGSQMGMELKIKGTSKRTATLYFAYKEGMLVKIKNDESSKIDIDAGTMVIPQTSESKSEVELVL